MHIDRAVEGVVIEPERVFDQALAGERATGLGRHPVEDLELRRRALDSGAPHPHEMTDGIELELADAARPAEAVAAEVGPRPPEHGANPRDELAWAEGLGHVVIRTEVEPEQDVFLGAARGEQDDRHVSVGTEDAARVEAVDCTPAEFKILDRMTAEPGRAFTRQRLIEDAFGFDHYALDRTVDVHILNLRKKIEVDPSAPQYLLTVYGVGYKLNDELEPADNGRGQAE